MQTTNLTPPEVGTHVFGSDGEEIGTISDVGPGYFHIKKGFFHKEEVYLPLDSITGTALGGDGVMINLTKEDIQSGDWSQPPATSEVADDDVTTRP
jgi:uncharacterized protein YrrD